MRLLGLSERKNKNVFSPPETLRERVYALHEEKQRPCFNPTLLTSQRGLILGC